MCARILQFVSFSIFNFLFGEHFIGNPSCEFNDQPNNQRAKKIERNEAPKRKIFQFPLQLLHKSTNFSLKCVVHVCVIQWVCRKRTKTSRTNKQNVRIVATIMEQLNGGSSNTQKKKHLFFVWVSTKNEISVWFLSLLILFFVLFCSLQPLVIVLFFSLSVWYKCSIYCFKKSYVERKPIEIYCLMHTAHE